MRRFSTVTVAFGALLCLANLDLLGGPAPSTSDSVAARVFDVPRYTDLALPPHFRELGLHREDNAPRGNPTTDSGAHLGRFLFYDPRLAKTGELACANCHMQRHAFGGADRIPLVGVGGKGTRNVPPIVNLRWDKRGFFWDGRAASIEQQVLEPLRSHREMGSRLDEVVAKLQREALYRHLFAEAFGDPEVTSHRISRALAQFVRSLVSYRSRFDDGLARTGSVDAEFPSFTAAENEGKRLFFARDLLSCASCHVASERHRPSERRHRRVALFLGDDLFNNGIDRWVGRGDDGLANVTGDVKDAGRFRAPSLRNVELTAPYMHDGRFATLEEVVNHYNQHVENHPNLDPRLMWAGRTPGRMNLSSDKRAALVAFLKTLTDRTFVEDPRFSDPFEQRR